MAIVALVLGAGTALIGLVAPSLRVLYDYSWFVGFTISFVTYYGLMRVQGQRDLAPEAP
jgi:cytosine/uracil/thiamine/allantoin permease